MRRLMAGLMNSYWDYELYKVDGYVPFFRLAVKAGQKIIVEYKHEDAIIARGYIYDNRSNNTGYCLAKDVSTKQGVVEFYIGEDGTVTFSGHHKYETAYQEDRYNGEYLKIRIE